MGEPSPWHDYLFVSDLHVSLGYDPERRAYHAREDFFFDEPFFRWLRWADQNCAPGRRWELVFVGDGLDFLPIDLEMVHQYFEARDRRWASLDPEDRRQVVAYWQQQFAEEAKVPPDERVPDWVRWILFEDDALAGRVRLTPLSPREMVTLSPEESGSLAPDWAVNIYGGIRPSTVEQARGGDPSFGLGEPPEGHALAFRVTEGTGEAIPRDLHREEAFERRYGFLPTQAKSMARLFFIYRGHPTFFRALAWFVGRGHRVTFVRGNHDLELFWPGVQNLFRQLVAREYAAAFESQPPPTPDLEERIDFRPAWFYYRPGLFYAEHGNQYEPIDSCPNFLRPLLPADPRYLNPPVGSMGVTTIVARMEDEFPEWENRGKHAVVIMELVRRYPHQAFVILTRHVRDYLWMAQQLWQATRGGDQEPTDEEFRRYADQMGLPPEMVKAVYYEWDPPLLLRRPLAWFLFSPGGHFLKALLVLLLAALAVGGLLLWYLVLAPLAAKWLSSTFGQALQLLSQVLLWLVPPLLWEWLRRRLEKWYPHPLMYWAARRVHQHLREVDPDLRFYIFGHDHKTDARIIERRPARKHVYYLNTGCWFPEFAEATRRLQTLNRDVQFTFVRLTRQEGGVEADLLRWNDDAGRAERQIVPPARPGQ